MTDDLRTQRDRRGGQLDRLARAVGEQADCVRTLVGKVYDAGAIPTQVMRFFAVRPVAVTGIESEGAFGGETVNANAQELVMVLGPRVPTVGDALIAYLVGDRWVAERGQTNGNVSLPGCGCDVPRALAMVSSDHNAESQMFQDATITYVPVPPVYQAMALGDAAGKGFFSTASFTDPDFGDQFQYYFTCSGSLFTLTRVYPSYTLTGTPFRDAVRYAWLVTTAGNSCHPFRLLHGTIFAGGDPNVVVTIAGEP